MKRYKVLIQCGGGIFGCIPARFLASLPEGASVASADLLSGCSIGGILAAAYAAGNSFRHVDEIFRSRASDCFKKRFCAYVNPLACPTYRNDSLDSVLSEMTGDRTLGDIKDIFPELDVVIPALNITDDSYKVFDNITGQDDPVPLSSVAGYTSAAPSYYSGRDFNGKCIVDGGMIEVAPLLTATTTLKAKRGVEFKDMDVLMIGTGRDIDENPLTLKKYNNLSLLGVATDVIVPYVTLSNEMATRFWGRHIGYGYFNYFNPCTTNGKLDDLSQLEPSVKQADSFAADFRTAWDEWLSA